jgi:predicted nucleic acid-binding protein
MNRYVIDATFLLKCLIPEEHSPVVILFGLQDNELIVPDLCYVEMTNVLWKKAESGEMTREEVLQALHYIGKLTLKVVPSKLLTTLSMEIALNQQCSVYEATYLAAAIEKNCSLVTADRPFYDKLKNSPFAHHIIWIEDTV